MPNFTWKYFIVSLLLVGAGVIKAEEGAYAPVVLTPEIGKGLGSAALLPTDTSLYSVSFDVKDRVMDIVKSKAVQSLVFSPGGQMGMAKLMESAPYRQFMHAKESDPRLQEILSLLEDMISQEIFMAADSQLAPFIEGITRIYNELFVLQMMQNMNDSSELSFKDILPLVAKHLAAAPECFRFPNGLLGFELSNPDAARRFLEMAYAMQEGAFYHPALELERIDENGIFRYTLSIDVCKDPELKELLRALRWEDISDVDRTVFESWIMGFHMEMSVTVKDGYLLLALGSDNVFIDKFAPQQDSLAKRESFNPVRRHIKEDGAVSLLNVSYQSEALNKTIFMQLEDVRKVTTWLEDVLVSAPVLGSVSDRIIVDLNELVSDIEPFFPTTYATFSYSFINNGLESFSYVKKEDQYGELDQILSVLEHRGKQSIVSIADVFNEDPREHGLFKKWINKIFDYAEELGLPHLPDEGQKKYAQVRAIAIPFLQQLYKITNEQLLPSVEGGGSLLTLDAVGLLENAPLVHGEKQAVINALVQSVPRVGIVVELKDANLFSVAMQGYIQALRNLIAQLQEDFPKTVPKELMVPNVLEKPCGNGILYTYHYPWQFGPDVQPSAILTDSHLYLSSSQRMLIDMQEKHAVPSHLYTYPDQPARQVVMVNFKELWQVLRRGITVMTQSFVQESGHMLAQEQMKLQLFSLHADLLIKSLGAIRSYTATVRVQNGYMVSHSHLHVEDLSSE